MKPFIQIFAAALICSIGGAAHATIVTYTYQAKVSSIKERTMLNNRFIEVMQSSMAEAPVAIGDIVTGSFQYDTLASLGSYQVTPSAGDSRMYDSGTNDYVSFVDKNTGLAVTSLRSQNSSAATYITDDMPVPGTIASDYFYMTRYADNDAMYVSAYIQMEDLTGKAFQSAAIPEELELAAFSYALAGGTYYRRSDSTFMLFSAAITSLERVNADVPEPSSAILFAIAAGGLFSLRRRRRA